MTSESPKQLEFEFEFEFTDTECASCGKHYGVRDGTPGWSSAWMLCFDCVAKEEPWEERANDEKQDWVGDK